MVRVVQSARGDREDIKTTGALIEWSSQNRLAIDAVDEEHAELVADFLAEREQQKQLIYETGRR